MRSQKMTFGLEKAPHRSLLYALGLTREEMKRPLIGVVNAANEVVPGHLHLGKIAEAVKAGIRMAGGTPMEFPAIAVCDGLAMNHEGMRFSLTSREVITDSIEIMATAHPFDALVFIPNCDKIVPGMLMAMMRLNLPSIIMSGGPMLAGRNNTDLISVFEGVGAVRNGTMTEEELEDLTENACPGCGSCSGMYTANTMNCLCEAMGVALPGNGTTPAVSAARIRLAKQAGMQVMELLEKNIRPRDIVTEQSVHNAVAADMALGGSPHTTLHLPAVFGEAELSLSLDIFDDISRKTPNICKLSPAGTQHIEDLHRAGGIPAVMGALLDKGLVHGEALTVTGKTVAENIKELKAHIIDPDVIRIDKPYAKEGGIAILRGNLAPDGAVVKQSAVAPEMMVRDATARVFNSEEEGVEAILGGKIKKGDVVVIRYEGPRGGPGMREMLTPTSAIVGMGLGADVALITDGRFSGGGRGGGADGCRDHGQGKRPAEQLQRCVHRRVRGNGIHVQAPAPPRAPVVVCAVAGRFRAGAGHRVAAPKTVALRTDLAARGHARPCALQYFVVVHVGSSVSVFASPAHLNRKRAHAPEKVSPGA